MSKWERTALAVGIKAPPTCTLNFLFMTLVVHIQRSISCRVTRVTGLNLKLMRDGCLLEIVCSGGLCMFAACSRVSWSLSHYPIIPSNRNNSMEAPLPLKNVLLSQSWKHFFKPITETYNWKFLHWIWAQITHFYRSTCQFSGNHKFNLLCIFHECFYVRSCTIIIIFFKLL